MKAEIPRFFDRGYLAALPLALLAVSFPLSASAHSSLDGIDCITSYSPPSSWVDSGVAGVITEQPLQVADNNSTGLPNDPERDVSVLADKASIPSRSDQGPTQFPGSSSFDVAALRSLGSAPLPLLCTHLSSSLNEHIRERAPPNLV